MLQRPTLAESFDMLWDKVGSSTRRQLLGTAQVGWAYAVEVTDLGLDLAFEPVTTGDLEPPVCIASNELRARVKELVGAKTREGICLLAVSIHDDANETCTFRLVDLGRFGATTC